MDTHAAQAMIRFGLGRRGNEPLPGDPARWLADQLSRPDPALALPGSGTPEALAAIRADLAVQKANHQLPPEQRSDSHPVHDLFVIDVTVATDTLLTTDTPFRERLVWFWANHFTISLRHEDIAAMTSAYLREAIRPHVDGRFVDMLRAVMHHPAMLIYLDNFRSVGPGSDVGRRQHIGLNENLARESLELHTLSPESGYTQADVTSYANILTGWSIDFAYAPNGKPGFQFRANAHEPGTKTVMGKVFPPGVEGGEMMLTWLADHPATHKHLASKLVRHFVADDPSPAAVARIEGVLRDTRGDLKAASLELTRLPEAWQPLNKIRSPADYAVAVLRAMDLPAEHRPNLQNGMQFLGQPIFMAPLPNGWPDTASDWAAP
jgi:uncharacterized protein (DUF1800 family)